MGSFSPKYCLFQRKCFDKIFDSPKFAEGACPLPRRPWPLRFKRPLILFMTTPLGTVGDDDDDDDERMNFNVA